MRTVEITRMEDVRVGDDITLTRDGLTVSGRVRSEGTAVDLADWHVYFPGIGTLYARDGWTLVSATREIPEYEPGTAGTATVRGVEGVRVMRTSGTGGADIIWLSASMVSGVRGHAEGYVTDFVPDDAEALRRSLEVTHENYCKEAADWRARDKRMGAEVDRLEAEVERWKAEAEMLTAKVDRLMPLQEHENECAYRQRTEKAEAEVGRLRATRTLPIFLEIQEAISQGFELDCNLTFEGGVPPMVTERVMEVIFESMRRSNDD